MTPRDLRLKSHQDWLDSACARTYTFEDFFSEEEFEAAFDETNKCSINRFLSLQDTPAAVNAIVRRTREMATDCDLSVAFTESPDNIAPCHDPRLFKYSLLQDSVARMLEGEALKVATIVEAGKTIAYGIAEPIKDGHKIEILDVEAPSRRQNGVALSLTIEGDMYSVGLGHVVVLTLMDSLQGSIVTDATTEQSQYIFTSLGFANVSSNPCDLRYPQ